MPETDEANNDRTVDFTLLFAELEIESLDIKPPSVFEKDSVEVSFKVKNRGTADVLMNIPVRFLFQASGSHGPVVWSPVMSSMEPIAKSKSADHKVTYKTTRPGKHSVVAVPHPSESAVFWEPDSSNNILAGTFEVKARKGPEIVSFKASKIDDESYKLAWEVVCDPPCKISMTKGVLGAPVFDNLAHKGEKTVQREWQDRVYTLVVKRDGNTLTEKESVRHKPGPALKILLLQSNQRAELGRTMQSGQGPGQGRGQRQETCPAGGGQQLHGHPHHGAAVPPRRLPLAGRTKRHAARHPALGTSPGDGR